MRAIVEWRYLVASHARAETKLSEVFQLEFHFAFPGMFDPTSVFGDKLASVEMPAVELVAGFAILIVRALRQRRSRLLDPPDVIRHQFGRSGTGRTLLVAHGSLFFSRPDHTFRRVVLIATV
jgi:hypothetical protein